MLQKCLVKLHVDFHLNWQLTQSDAAPLNHLQIPSLSEIFIYQPHPAFSQRAWRVLGGTSQRASIAYWLAEKCCGGASGSCLLSSFSDVCQSEERSAAYFISLKANPGSSWTWETRTHGRIYISTCSTSSSHHPWGKNRDRCVFQKGRVGETPLSASQRERYSGGRGQRRPVRQFTALPWESHMIPEQEWKGGKAGTLNLAWQFYLDCQIKHYLQL